MAHKKIAFIFGGPGAEHEVSLATAQSVLPAFEGVQLLPIFITQQRQWVVAEEYSEPQEAWDVAQTLIKRTGTPADIALEEIERHNPDLVFLGLHGEFGEDGTIQALLEGHGLAFTGSDSEASALGIDKPKVFQLLQDEGIAVPDFLEVTEDTQTGDIESFMAFCSGSLVVMPADRGSSQGVSIIHDPKRLPDALAQARQFSPRVLVKQYIHGREFSCGLLVTSPTDLTPLPPTEIIPKDSHTFFDYDAKYVAGEVTEVTPPNLASDQIVTLQKLAKRVHQLIGADGYSRVDAILNEQNEFVVLEINTLPGLTATSILPQQAAVYGLSFNQLLTAICDSSDTTGNDYITAISE